VVAGQLPTGIKVFILGSHQMIEPPIDMVAFGSGMGPHPEEVKIAAPAGSVILFTSAGRWHSGTVNNTPGSAPGGHRGLCSRAPSLLILLPKRIK